MGRISKRKRTGRQLPTVREGKRYKAGIYARLSSDQAVEKNESIEVQIQIAEKFAEEFNHKRTGEFIDIVECYTDLGKTGSNFEREGFLRLLQDIRLGEINCVIVKDLSRFGRNYLEAGNYIEKIFPFLGVRFIAVSDGFDTQAAGNDKKQMSCEIKNLVNDMYAKDFSQKAKIHLKQRREEGTYVGGAPPYGYVAEWDGRRRVLIPDDNTAAVVRFIYEKFVETESYTAVAKELSRRKINPPYLYKKTGDVYYSAKKDCFREAYHESASGEYKGWDKGAVERIVKSETYAGTLVQGKTSITARNEKNRIHRSEQAWVITKAAHEPIVDAELYRNSRVIMQKIKRKTASHKHSAKEQPTTENIFGDVLCYGLNRISKNVIVDILLSLIRMEFKLFLAPPNTYMEYGKNRIAEAVKRTQARQRETEGSIRRFCEAESAVYMDYRAGKLQQKEYIDYKLQQKAMLADLRKRQEAEEKEIKALAKLSDRYLAAIRALLKLKSEKELTKDMVEIFVSQIHVYPENRVEVLFAFTVDCRKERR